MAKEVSIYDLANSIVKKNAPKTQINEVNTGKTYFINPKQRLCKVVLTKKALRLECNIELTDSLVKSLNEDKSILSVEVITKDIAKKKKYGTMKHLVTAIDCSRLEEIIKDMLTTWNK